MSNSENKHKKQTSLRRQAASRANGAKSHGPVTPEGKAISCQNAVKHGLLAAVITLTPQDEEIYKNVEQRYIARFEPRDQVEFDLVEQIAFANYKLREVWIYENSLLGIQIELDQDAVDMEWSTISELDRRALAFVQSIKDTNALPLLQRYARSYANQAERAIKLLLELKKQRIPPAPAPAPEPQPQPQPELRKEPSPTNGHPEPGPSQPEIRPETPVSYVGFIPGTVRIAPKRRPAAPVPAPLAMTAGAPQ